MATETTEEKIARLEAENARLVQDSQDAEQAISELNEKLANAEAVAPEQTVVTYEKAQYRVLAQKFSYNGQEIEAKDLQSKKDVLKALVEAGSGLLVKVEATKK